MFIFLGKCLNNKTLGIGIFALAIFLSPFQTAHAYIDPGTGSYILQITIGIIFGAAFAIKSFWSNIIGFLSGKKAARKKAKDSHNEGSPKNDHE